MIDTLVILAGLAQIAVALGSLLIPRQLGWKEQTAKLDGLTRQVFWTYAGYILGTNVFFGVLSVFAAPWLTDGSGNRLPIDLPHSIFDPTDLRVSPVAGRCAPTKTTGISTLTDRFKK